jgi:hypothetical protein
MIRSGSTREYDDGVRLWLLAFSLLLVSGCASGRQLAAVDAVSKRAPGTDVSCTRSAHTGFVREVPTKIFFCIAKHGGNDCDHYRATLTRGVFDVALLERDGECVLPAS